MRSPRDVRRARGFSLMEVLISLGIIAVLLAVLLPALSSGRAASHELKCCSNQRHIGSAWHLYLTEHGDEFPFLPVQGGFRFGGARISPTSGATFLDYQRPLNSSLMMNPASAESAKIFRCPADRSLGNDAVGTGRRTAFEAFGTSYRANDLLMDARRCGITDDARGVKRGEIRAAPSRMLITGDLNWYETFHDTGRSADWHGSPGKGNLLFLDGSVRTLTVRANSRNQPMVIHPALE